MTTVSVYQGLYAHSFSTPRLWRRGKTIGSMVDLSSKPEDRPFRMCDLCQSTVDPEPKNTIGMEFGTEMAEYYLEWEGMRMMTKDWAVRLLAQQFTGLKVFPARVVKLMSRFLPREFPEFVRPMYVGKVGLLPIEGLPYCPKCGGINRHKIPPGHPAIPDLNTWDGSDFCLAYQNDVFRFVSRRVVEFAVEQRVEAVHFEYPDTRLKLPKISTLQPETLEAFDAAYATAVAEGRIACEDSTEENP